MAQRAPDISAAKIGGLADKLSDLAERYAALREEAQRAAMGEGLTRARLLAALAALAGAEQTSRQALLAAYRAAARPHLRPRRRNRVARRIDGALSKVGALGEALLIARSGVWRPSGSGLADLLAILAYARRGADPAAQPAALFDHSLAGLPGRGGPLARHLVSGEGESLHPLFHAGFYSARNTEALGATGLSPLEHFVRVGAGEGRDPHPLFSIEHYLAQAPDLVESGDNPLEHYLAQGATRGLSPHPLFAADYYADQAGAGSSLVHYLTHGWKAGLKPHPLFDPAAYLALYPDVAEGGHEPLTHYALVGGVEGRVPSPWFDAPDYMLRRGPARPADLNPLVDYLLGGAWAVGEAWLDPDALEVTGMTPLERWARLGARPA